MKSVIAGLLLAAPLMANAYSIAPDVLDFNPNPLISSGGAYHYSHNLTDNAGYNPLDAITNFQLELKFADAGSDLLDFTYINYGTTSNLWTADGGALFYNWSYASLTTDATANGLLQIKDGILDVTVSSLFGSFYLDKSTLTAEAKSANVPEPSSIALLAAGLLGIAVMRRKSKMS